MTNQIAGFYAFASSPVPEEFHGADSHTAIRLRWLSGSGLVGRSPWTAADAPHDSTDAGYLSQADTRIEDFRTLPRRERPNGL
jgi:hypothetical protein